MAQTSTDYTDTLIVTVDGVNADPLEATITMEQLESGNINIILKNFILQSAGESMPIGTIVVEDIEVTQEDGYKSFNVEGKTATITDGDLEGVSFWVGSLMFSTGLDIDISGKFTDEQLYCVIDLSFTTQIIEVKFGTDFTADDNDNEDDEPNTGETATSTDYTDTLIVTVDGVNADPLEATITMEQLESGNINIILKNFILQSAGESMPIGTIVVEDIEVTQEDGYKSFNVEGKTATITDGDLEGVSFWVGSLMFSTGLDIDISGKFTDEQLYCVIDLSFTTQIIEVKFGTDFTADDNDNEDDEPNTGETATSTDYTDTLIVTVDGVNADPLEATITMEQLESGNINIILKNFILQSAGESMPIGTIVVEDIEVTQEDGYKSFNVEGKTATITDGDLEGVSFWVGSLMFSTGLDIDISGKFTDEQLYCVIDLSFTTQIIEVKFGTDFTADDNDNEDDEPNTGETATSTDYTDTLIVTVDGVNADPLEATITMEQLESGNINIILKNFILQSAGESMPIGTIVVEDIEVTQEDGYKSFSAEGLTATITDGDLEDVTYWVGSLMFSTGLPIDISGKFTDEQLYCAIDISFGSQTIEVKFGTDFTAEDGDGGTTAIQATAADNGTKQLVDVYTLSGSRIKSNVEKADALNGLQRGIYIVNGKKVIKK